jgi:hypothetical protein
MVVCVIGMMTELNGKQRSSSMFSHDVSGKHPCFIKQVHCSMTFFVDL